MPSRTPALSLATDNNVNICNRQLTNVAMTAL